MMATYFQGGDNNLQTLYLMNPNYITPPPYSEPHLNDMPHHQHQLIGIPLSGTHPSNDLGRTSSDHHHNQFPPSMLWSPTRSNPINDFSGQMDFRQPMSSAQSGLSLSLTPGQQQHRSHNHGGGSEEDMRMSVTVAGGPGTYNGPIAGSKYLKATQELLEEVVNVKPSGSSNKGGELSDGVHKHKAKAAVKYDDDDDGAGYGGQGGSGGDSGSGSKKGVELTTAQKHELQMKKAKLLNMLDEVEQRYRQYQSQMQVVVSSFEQTAGLGSAKSYTSLALKTISKQFKCLKDTIASQIKATSKSLGEEDNEFGEVKLERTRLRFIDQQLRQQRALQQLGMVQNNAWRPQRGLPERAVSVLRAWLFEHFLHPYPKDSDKHMLAKQTGLTRSQVSNWFINARVRLWKPMVEEMYVEEMKSQEQNGVTSEENTNTATNTTDNGGIGSSSSKNENHFTTNKTSIMGHQHEQQHEDVGFNMIQTNQNNHIQQQTTNDMISSLSTMSTTTTSSHGFTLIGSSLDMESLMARSPKKQRSNSDMNSPSSILSMDMEMKPINQRHNSSFMTSHGSEAGGVGFNPYIVDNDIGRFTPNQINQSYNGNAVSLTLGLPHCENLSLSENHQQNYFQNQGMQLGRRVEIGQGEGEFCGVSMGQTSLPSNGYETIDMQSRKRFAAQILHDFVA